MSRAEQVWCTLGANTDPALLATFIWVVHTVAEDICHLESHVHTYHPNARLLSLPGHVEDIKEGLAN